MDTWQVMDSIMFYEGIKWVFIYNYPNISYATPERAVYMDDQALGCEYPSPVRPAWCRRDSVELTICSRRDQLRGRHLAGRAG